MSANLADHTQLLQRLSAMRNERESWVAHWRDLSRMFQPRAGRFMQSDRNRGAKRHHAIYDNTTLRAPTVLAAGLQSGMTSPARPWLRLSTPDAELSKRHGVRQWLDDVTRTMLAILRRGNFYDAVHQGYLELAVFGTDAMIFEEDFDAVMHLSGITCGEYMIATDWRGNVNTFAREFERPVGAVVGEFGLDNVSHTVASMYRGGQLDAWVPLVHIIEPRAARDRKPGSALARDMAFRSVYFEPGNSSGRPLREGGYRQFPVICSRWSVYGGDIYGSSPAMAALGDAQQLQKQQLRKGQAIDYSTRPPMSLPTALKNSGVNTLPGGENYVDNPSQAQPLWQPTLRLDHLLSDMQEVRQRINSAFYVDMFLMLSQMDQTRMTATEVAERHHEKLLMLGPTSERQHHEKLRRAIDLLFERMLRAGLVPPPPQELQGSELTVEFIGTIAQAQREVGVGAIDRYVGNLGQIAAFAPSVLDKFPADRWADEYSERLGVPADLVVPTETAVLVRQARAEEQAKAMQAEQAMAQAKALQSLGNTPVDGALAALVNGGGLVQTENPARY